MDPAGSPGSAVLQASLAGSGSPVVASSGDAPSCAAPACDAPSGDAPSGDAASASPVSASAVPGSAVPASASPVSPCRMRSPAADEPSGPVTNRVSPARAPDRVSTPECCPPPLAATEGPTPLVVTDARLLSIAPDSIAPDSIAPDACLLPPVIRDIA